MRVRESTSRIRAVDNPTQNKRLCIGFGITEGVCISEATVSLWWCPTCERLRRKHLNRQFDPPERLDHVPDALAAIGKGRRGVHLVWRGQLLEATAVCSGRVLTRRFNGEPGPTIDPRDAVVLERTYEDA